MTGQNHQEIPDPEALARWIQDALDRLGKKPSNFLLDDDKPGSKNRISNVLKNPTGVKLLTARRIQTELEECAAEIGVNLPPLKAFPPEGEEN